MQKIDVVFRQADTELTRAASPMSPANLAELSAELGHAMTLVELPACELTRGLENLLATNASPEEDWLIQASNWLLTAAKDAVARGATAVRFEARAA